MKMRTLLQGGMLIDGSQMRREDLMIEDGKIVSFNTSDSMEQIEVVDVSGKYIFPGFIDAHTHFDLPFDGYSTADDFASGTKAAIVGGTTCIIDFATQFKGQTLRQGLSTWKEKARGKSSCDYAFHLAISDWNDGVRGELKEMVKEGVTSFKLYMTYDAMKVSDEEIYEILKCIDEVGGIACVHCENDGIIKAKIKEEKAKGTCSVKTCQEVRPATVEQEAIHRLLIIAQEAGVPVIVVHLSTKLGLHEIRQARLRGQNVHIETCPQYLLLDKSKYELSPEESRGYVCAPALRGQMDQSALWDGIQMDEIQLISTDHCSFTREQKAMGANDFTKIPGGLPGVEHRPVLVFSNGVKAGRITLSQFAYLLSEGPARLYGLYPNKGSLQVGSDADLVVWNPDVMWTITQKEQQSKAGYTPYEGMDVVGVAERVYLRGELVVNDGLICKENQGSYQKRGRVDLGAN